MARIEELLTKIGDAEIRAEVEREVAALKDHTNFGLVFERHIPETVVLDGAKPKVGDLVQSRRDAQPGLFRVFELKGDVATIASLDGQGVVESSAEELLVVRPFGEPLYPAFTPLEAVTRSDDRPFHAVLNGENLNALQLLLYLYESQVDCIYIDPPYNSGATDWKYNNRYVDESDRYRHSKWLSMMERRLRLARRLLRPNGVLVVTIDENEFHHLGLLLEELFPDARRQTVTICINPGGASGSEGGLSRVEEYAFFCFLGGAQPATTDDDMLVAGADTIAAHTESRGIRWEWLMRGGNVWYRASRPNLCYPILLNADGTQIVEARDPYEGDEDKRPAVIEGHPVAWPVRRDGKLGIWRVDAARLQWLNERGYAFVSKQDKARGTWTIKYLMSGTVEDIESDAIEVTGRGERGEVQVRVEERRMKTAKTMWYRGRHIAGGAGGTHLLNALLGERNVFSFPKSVYAVRDCLEVAVGDRPDALILDFFAGSGTTLNATWLLNASDGGNRRCILVTNNEVDPKTAKRLNETGSYRGDQSFEQAGIFEAVTRPRCKAAITGKRPDAATAEGSYLDGRSYSDGFSENVEFYRLDYLDPDDVELKTDGAFEAIHPALWLIAGGKAPRPGDVDPSKPYYLAERAGYAILFYDTELRNFEEALSGRDDITHVFIVTDSEEAFIDARELVGHGRETSMLYRDYLRNFRINTPRELM